MMEQQEPIFGKNYHHHVISYKKFPWVQYQNYFSDQICDLLINKYTKKYQGYDNDKSTMGIINIFDQYKNTSHAWITDPIWNLIKDSNDSNFLLDINRLYQCNILHFGFNNEWNFHEDCDWWFNPLPFDKKLTMIIELDNYYDYEGGEYGCYMNTVPIPKKHLTRGTVTIFPSFIRYSVEPITKGNKKILLAYATGPKFR